jgi:2-C-methyl-D-erythritol 2,4-cyclodiphosphate synthase
VLIHAIIDALLGALALGDIGKLFPDNDPSYKNIDSRILLRQTVSIIRDKGYVLSNLDCTVCTEQPKLQHFIAQMRNNLAEDLQTDMENISIKATTEEGLGVSGNGDGISVYCVLLLSKS